MTVGHVSFRWTCIALHSVMKVVSASEGDLLPTSALQVKSPNHGEETETQTVWPHFRFLWHGEDNYAVDSERSKKERKTKEEMGRKL